MATFAIYCDERTIVREICDGVVTRRIAKHIEPDGRQPFELARTRPMTYAAYNLRGLMTLADAGAEVGVDLWHAESADGRSIRRACDWFTNAALAPSEGELDTIAERAAAIFPALRRAAIAYRSDTFDAAIGRLPAEVRDASTINLIYPRG